MKNVAILGLGNIAKRVAKGILCSPKARLYAVASRNLDKAMQFAKEYGSTTYYGNYLEMLQDSNVDLVYICTPNSLHYEQIKMCLKHGKHVVCEKPMVKNEAQIKELFAYAKSHNLFLMEAEKTMFTPLNQKIKTIINEGVIGKLHTIKAQYCCDILEDVDANHWVLNGEMSGCSYDIGVYPICLAHFYAASNIKDFKVDTIVSKDFQCDFGMDANVFYENGIYASLSCNWFYHIKDKGAALLIGDQGYIEIPAYWKGTIAFLHHNDTITNIEVSMQSDFEGEVTHAIECIENGLNESPILNEQMSIDIIRIVESVQKNIRL